MIPKQLKSYRRVSKRLVPGLPPELPLGAPGLHHPRGSAPGPAPRPASRGDTPERAPPSARPPGGGAGGQSRGRRAGAILQGGGGAEPRGTGSRRPSAGAGHEWPPGLQRAAALNARRTRETRAPP